MVRMREFLAARGAAEMVHPGGTLLSHLVRVGELLAGWGASGEVQAAGLCHAAYGTDGFAAGLLDVSERAVLAELIGGRAEALVYLYGSCDRSVTYPRLESTGTPVFRDRFTGAEHPPGEEELRAFVELTAANELDVFAHDLQLASRYGPAVHRLLAAAHHWLSPAAWASVQRQMNP